MIELKLKSTTNEDEQFSNKMIKNCSIIINVQRNLLHKFFYQKISLKTATIIFRQNVAIKTISIKFYLSQSIL